MAKTLPQSALMAAVLSQAPVYWLDVVPQEFRQELEELRQAFVDGRIPSKRYVIARIAIAHGKERGIRMPSEKTVAEWLRRNAD